MSIRLISALAVVIIAVQALPASADQQSDDTDSSPLDAAGWEVLRHAPRLLPSGDTAGELQRILTQDEYKDAPGKEAQESWAQNQWDRIQQMLAGLSVIGTGVWGLVAAGLLLALLAFLVARLLWQWATHARSGTAADEPGTGPPQTTKQLLEAAEIAARRGDFRAAIRFRYLALLRALNLPTAALMTNSQIRRRVVSRNPALQGAMGDLVIAFEDCWYGGVTAGQQDYERASGLAHSIEDVLSEQSEDEPAD